MSKRTRNKRRDADFAYQDDTDDDQTEANALIKESETDMAGQGADVGATANALITQSTGSVNLEAILSQLAVGVSNLQKTLNGLSLNRDVTGAASIHRSNAGAGSDSACAVDSSPLVDRNSSACSNSSVDRGYIYNFKELGGNNVSFFPNGKLHPIAFLRKIKNIFSEAGVPERHKLGLVLTCLKGTAADWASIKEKTFLSFDDFETAFVSRFWGVDKQRDLFLKLNYGQFEGGSRSEYFLDLFNQAGFLSTPLPDQKIISMLSRHFSPDIQRGIISLGLNSFDEIDEYLRNIDSTYSFEQNSSGDTRGVPAQNRLETNRTSANNNWRRPNGRSTGDDRPPDNNNRGVKHIQITRFNEELGFSSDSDCGDAQENSEPDLIKSIDVAVRVGDIETSALIDCGSEITAISEKFYKKVSKTIQIALLPAANLSIRVAIGGKQQRIKSQVLLPVTVLGANIQLDVKCLVVPDLNREILFGLDWLKEYKAIVDFDESILRFSHNSKSIVVNFGASYSEGEMSLNNVAALSVQIKHSSPNVRHFYTKEEISAVAEKADAEEVNRKMLGELLGEFADIFSECPGQVRSYEHSIDMIDEKPFHCSNYPIPFAYRDEVRSQVEEMLVWGVIERSKSEHISPLVTVKKKDGSVRICLDARTLNKKMRKDFVNPPNVNELLMSFKQDIVISSVDLTASYWQIPIGEKDRKFIGFIYEGDSYVFRRLPFGLSTSMASLIRCLNQVLGPEAREFTIAYVDDLLVFSDTVTEHFKHLRLIFEKFRLEGITVKLRKCQFIREKVMFLGHEISSKGISMDPKRVEAILEFPTPRNVRELRGFLGLVNYEKRFCDRYSELTVPLLRLLKKEERWSWGSIEKEAFNAVKRGFLDATTVSHPDFKRGFFVQCDSSDYAIGGSLYQMSDNQERNVIAYTSITLKGSQLAYTTTEKELLALVHCLRQWRTFLLGQDVTVLTDHKSLCFLFTSRFKSARLTRWILCIQEFDFNVIHCPGSENRIADTLSRYPASKALNIVPDRSSNIHVMAISMTDRLKQLKSSFQSLREDQLEDSWMGTKVAFLEQIQTCAPIFSEKEFQITQWFRMHDGVLFKRGDSLNPGYKICVPKAQVVELVTAYHENNGHFGRSKTYSQMREKFYWPKMQRHIGQIVTSCDLCQKSKVSNKSRGLLHPVLPEKPSDLVCVDLMGPLPVSRGGVSQLLVVVDAFTKYVKLYALKKASARAIVNRLLNDYFVNIQKPRSILSDNGSQFTGKYWNRIMKEQNISVVNTSVYFPEGNLTERYNREIGRLLRAYCYDKHTRWGFMLDFVEKCLNSAVNEITGYAPSMLQTGEPIPHLIDKLINFPTDNHTSSKPSQEQLIFLARENLKSKAEKRADRHNASVKAITFQVGDKVLIRDHSQSSAENRLIKKFFLLYHGPFYVLRQAGPNSYVVGDVSGKEVSKQNIINLKRYRDPLGSDPKNLHF